VAIQGGFPLVFSAAPIANEGFAIASVMMMLTAYNQTGPCT